MVEDYYLLLGVPRDATVREIGRAYRQKARPFHDDAKPDNPDARTMFQRLSEAGETLRDPQKRAIYDATLPPISTRDDASAPPPSANLDRRPLPPDLDPATVNFVVVEQDNGSSSVIDVKIHNSNGNPALQPVVQPLSGQFWEATFGTGKTHFFISTAGQDAFAPGVYGDSLEVHWKGIPDLATTLPISLTVKTQPVRPRRNNPTGTYATKLRPRVAFDPLPPCSYRPDLGRRLVGAVLLMLLGIACLIAPPLLSRLPYFQQPDLDSNVGLEIAALLLFAVWLVGSSGCFYGAYHLLDDWRSSKKKNQLSSVRAPHESVSGHSPTALLILGFICLVVPPFLSLPLYFLQANPGGNFNDDLFFVLLGFAFLVGAPLCFYKAYEAKKRG